ncbi:MAG TPA: glycoside-pentoside-hexuronide (GPH):cation symporter [Clostridia bacterium]|nr:glycoside-pentoside-hexuronide (GPH):cation symporter [Clostridia bacterium]
MAGTKTAVADPIEAQRVREFNRNKWLFSTGGIGRDMSYQLVSAFLLVYVQFAVSLTVAQFTTLSLIIGIGGRLWDAFNDPIMGAIIEGSHIKWGKFKPWILIGAVTCGAVILAMYNVRVFTGWNFVIFMTIMYFLWETTFTMNDIGYWSMLPSLSSKRNERNTVAMMTVIFAGIGAFAGQGLVTFTTPGNMVAGYRLCSIIIVAAFIGCQIMTAVGVKERERTQAELEAKISLKQMWKTIRNNDQVLWMTLSMLFYNIGSNIIVGLAYNLYYLEVGYDSNSFYFIVLFGVVSILGNLFYPRLAKRLGRKKLQFISAMTAVFGYAGIALIGWWEFLPFNIVTFAIFGFFVFLGQTLFYMASIINITNCVEYNELKQGERNEAVVSTLRPFMAKFASAVQYGLVTLVLVVSGVFILSQNISQMESQKNYLETMGNSQDQIKYILKVKDYFEVYESHDQKEAARIVDEMIANDEFMSHYQIKAEYVDALKNCRIYAIKDGKPQDLGKWEDIEAAQLDTSAKYSIEIRDGDNNFNAANQAFKEQRSISMRLWLRAAVSLIPIIFLIVAWFIQNKKFIIDEKYYDDMIAEIERRKQAQTEEQQ